MSRVRASAVARPPPPAVAPPLHPHRPPLRLAPQRAPRTLHPVRLVARPQVSRRAARGRRHTRVRSRCPPSPVRRPHYRSPVAASRCRASSSSIPRARASSSPARSRRRPTTRTPRPRRMARPLRRATRICTGRRRRDIRDTQRLRRTGSLGMMQERVAQGKVHRACRRAMHGVPHLCSRTTTTRNGDEQVAAGSVPAPSG